MHIPCPMRVVRIAAFFVCVPLVALATPAAADPVCVPVPDADGHVWEACAQAEACSALGFCIDVTDPTGTAKALVAWAKDPLGPCICDPKPNPGP